MAEGAGAAFRPGIGGRVAGAKPEVDGARAGPEGTAKTAKYATHEKKKTRTSTRRAGQRRPCGLDAGEGQGWQRMGMPCGNQVDRRPVAHPPFWGVERREGGGGAARQPRRSQEEVRSRIGL